MPRASIGFGDRARAAVAAFRRGAASIDSRPKMRAFGGASTSRLTADWNPYVASPNREVRAAIVTLRARARQLVKDNSHAAGFVNELANQVIGPKGILMQARVANADGAPAKATNQELERGWKEWGMPENCSADGYESWTDFQRTVIRTLATDGEVFIQKIPYYDNPFGFSVRLIDADLVDSDFNRAAGAGANEIRMGIEINQYGRPIAFHVWTSYAGDGQKRERQRIPADQIIHRFVRYRANQPRGVTWFAPVLLDLHMLDGYEYAELTAARVAAAKMGFVLNKSPEAISAFDWDTDAKREREQMEVTPGVFEELLPGQEFQSFDPNHPSAAFGVFTKTVLRAIARGLNMAYTTLTGDLEAVNYSSIRAGLLSERDMYRYLQGFLGVHICRPIYRAWLPSALLMSAIKVDSRLASNYESVEWRGRGWKWVDPVNDMTAAALAIALGLDSRQSLAAEQGRDFEEIVDEIAAELEYADMMNVNVEGEAAKLAKTTIPVQGATDDNLDDAGDSKDTSNEPADTSHPAPKKTAMSIQRHRQITALRAAITMLERAA